MSIAESSTGFLEFLDSWYNNLPYVVLHSLLEKIPAEQTALFAVDLVNGFCKKGTLASPRVGQIVEPTVQLIKAAAGEGIRHFVLPQDNHPADSTEFEIYPRHCTVGSEEAETVPELRELPQAGQFTVFSKVTINPGLETSLQNWLDRNRDLRQFLVAGDCTDICVYQLALFLKLRPILKNQSCEVIVPANCVDTYDIPLEAYEKDRIPPHPGELIHRFFLYHMYLNGIRIYSRIE